MAKWRIVEDRYAGYEVQVWQWFWPFWMMPGCNTHPSVEAAEEYAKRRSTHNKVVKVLDL